LPATLARERQTERITLAGKIANANLDAIGGNSDSWLTQWRVAYQVVLGE
jgi:hypothetical protein